MSKSNVWDRSTIEAFGAPPKVELDTTASSRSSVTFRHDFATIRRAPNATQSALLRKTRNFALQRFDTVHPPSADGKEDWAEIYCKPPREMSEIRPAWVRACLLEGGVLPGSADIESVEQLEAVRSSSNCQAIRLGIVYKGHSAAEWPTSVLLKMNSFGPQEHPQLEHEQAYLQAELAFLCDAMAATDNPAVRAPRVYWSYNQPPEQGDIRTHWKWARGRFPEHPWTLGEYCCLVEDLNANHRTCTESEMTMETASAVVGAMAKLHASFWEHELLGQPCFKARETADMSEVKHIIQGMVERSQLEEHVAAVYVPAVEVRVQLVDGALAHGRTLIRGRSAGSLQDWILTPEGPSSSSWGHVTVGSGTKDLALFLTLSLTKEQQDEWTHALVDAYYTSLIAGGVDGDIYKKLWFVSDFQVMLWEVAHEHLLPAGRRILALPMIGQDTAFRERKRIMEAIGPAQHVIASVSRALALGDAWQVVGVESDSDE